MQAWEAMTIATGLTAVRVFVERTRGGLTVDQPETVTTEVLNVATGETETVEVPADPSQSTVGDTAGTVARVVVGGVLASFLVILAEQANPKLARGFAALVLVTSILVNGVALADIATEVIS